MFDDRPVQGRTGVSTERHLLLIAYHFPPRGGSGVQRALKLARYLPQSGWRAHVICAGHRHFPLMDESLLEEADTASVYPTRGYEPAAIAERLGDTVGALMGGRNPGDSLAWRLNRWFDRLGLNHLLMERERLWTTSAYAQARRIARQYPIEAVVTTSPVCVTHLVGRRIKRRLGLPWIADLRDPIVDNFVRETRSAFVQRSRRRIEQQVLCEADQVVVTCPELSDRLTERYASAITRPILTIPNGYDPADCPAAPARNSSGMDRFTLTYVGSFYREQSVLPLVEALRMLRQMQTELPARINFRIVGSISESQRSLLREKDRDLIEIVGYQTHAQAVAEMTAADALILTIPSNEGGRYCIPAKVYEYLAFGGHILANVHPGTAIAGILQQAGGCTLLTESSPQAWRQAIVHCCMEWKAGQLTTRHRTEVVERFRRDWLTALYARAIEGCLTPGEERLALPDPFSAKEAA